MFALASVPGVKNGDTIGKLLLLLISLLVEGDVNRWFDFDGVANNLLADLDLEIEIVNMVVVEYLATTVTDWWMMKNQLLLLLVVVVVAMMEGLPKMLDITTQF